MHVDILCDVVCTDVCIYDDSTLWGASGNTFGAKFDDFGWVLFESV